METKDYSEVRCEYCSDGFWFVDAWLTDADDEEGRTVAVIHDLTGDVHYEPVTPHGFYSKRVREVVKEKVREIRKALPAELAVLYKQLSHEEKEQFYANIEWRPFTTNP